MRRNTSALFIVLLLLVGCGGAHEESAPDMPQATSMQTGLTQLLQVAAAGALRSERGVLSGGGVIEYAPSGKSDLKYNPSEKLDLEIVFFRVLGEFPAEITFSDESFSLSIDVQNSHGSPLDQVLEIERIESGIELYLLPREVRGSVRHIVLREGLLEIRSEFDDQVHLMNAEIILSAAGENALLVETSEGSLLSVGAATLKITDSGLYRDQLPGHFVMPAPLLLRKIVLEYKSDPSQFVILLSALQKDLDALMQVHLMELGLNVQLTPASHLYTSTAMADGMGESNSEWFIKRLKWPVHMNESVLIYGEFSSLMKALVEHISSPDAALCDRTEFMQQVMQWLLLPLSAREISEGEKLLVSAQKKDAAWAIATLSKALREGKQILGRDQGRFIEGILSISKELMQCGAFIVPPVDEEAIL